VIRAKKRASDYLRNNQCKKGRVHCKAEPPPDNTDFIFELHTCKISLWHTLDVRVGLRGRAHPLHHTAPCMRLDAISTTSFA